MANWCSPCREEFPTINKLSKEFTQVEFLGISIDYQEEVRSKIIPSLKSQKVNFVNYAKGFEKDEDRINMLDTKWKGSFPATFVIDRNSKKLSILEWKKFYNEFKKELVKAQKN